MRLLIVSIRGTTVPTKNRKTVSFSSTINHNGINYEINGSETHGVYLQLVHAMIEQLEICLSMWGRVFAMRFDLRQMENTGDSKMLTSFRKNLKRRLERKYQMANMGYMWVREQESAKQQHYHFVIFLDGDKIRHSSVIIKIIMETWENLKSGNTVGYVKRCFYNVSDSNSKADAIYRFSYLAKARGKSNRPPQSKDYGTSRMKLLPRRRAHPVKAGNQQELASG